MRVLRDFFSPPHFGKSECFLGVPQKTFFRACRASVEIRKTRIPAKGFAPARETRTGFRQKVGVRKPGDHKPDDKPDDAPTQQAKVAPKLILSSEQDCRQSRSRSICTLPAMGIRTVPRCIRRSGRIALWWFTPMNRSDVIEPEIKSRGATPS